MDVAASLHVAPAPVTLRAEPWSDYALLDSGGGRKLERAGPYRLVRPEPQCLWRPRLDEGEWASADAAFDASDEEEAGRWRLSGKVDETWPMAWRGVRFLGRLTAFRHLGFFPEQAANWDWLDQRLKGPGPARVLNLFGYTGISSLVCAAAGASVTHVDASKKAIGWARENAALSKLHERPIRWICEDARRYVQREARRGSQYEGIVLDPPKYGRGPTGEVWRLFEDLPELLAGAVSLLSPDASFVILNAYAERVSAFSLATLLAEAMAGRGGRIDYGELALMEQSGHRGVGLSFFRALERVMAARKLITSLANDTVKAARALHMRKAREETGQFLVEGLKLVTEAIDHGHAPEVLLFGPDAAGHSLLHRAIAATDAAGGEVVEVTPAILGKIARRENPQMVIGIFSQAYATLDALKPEDAACWIALEEVRDPGNLGTIIRTADAAGCGGVILVGDCCDPYSVEATRATMGSIFAVPLARATLQGFLTFQERWPGSVVGTLLTATEDYRAAPYRAPTLLVMGAEQSGLSPRLAAACDVAVKIPMRGRADSLNLAVATGIMIYAVTG